MTGKLFSGIGKLVVPGSLSIPVIVTMFSRLSSCLTPMIEPLSLVLLMARYVVRIILICNEQAFAISVGIGVAVATLIAVVAV